MTATKLPLILRPLYWLDRRVCQLIKKLTEVTDNGD